MRDDAVTYSKAIAIVLMVMGHACYSTHIESWVNMFHVPTFFFLSGFCFKDKYLHDFKTFAKQRIIGIYWPLLKWTLLFILIHNTLFSLGIYNNEYGYGDKTSYLYSLHDIVIRIKGLLFNLSVSENLLGGYWFLVSLFIGSFIFYAIIRLTYNNKILLYLGGEYC